MAGQPKTRARHGKFTPAVATKVCELIAAGESVAIAAGKAGISERSIRLRVADDPAFREQYRSARAYWCESLADETLALADGAVAEARAAGETANAVVQALRLQIDTRKWLLARLAPHLLGDRVELTGAGGDPLIPAPEIDTGKLALALCNLLAEAKKSEPLPPVTIDAEPVADTPALPEPLAPPQAQMLPIVTAQDSKVVALQQRRPALPDGYWRR